MHRLEEKGISVYEEKDFLIPHNVLMEEEKKLLTILVNEVERKLENEAVEVS